MKLATTWMSWLCVGCVVGLLPAQEPRPAASPPPPRDLEPPGRTSPPPRGDLRAPPANVYPLRLDEVLQAVETQFPLIVAAEQERGITAGQVTSAEGAFDTNFRGFGIAAPGHLNTFENYRVGAMVEQFLANGMSFIAGYRDNHGEFPVYYGDRLTADGGEYRLGVNMPLLRDRAIDRRRAGVATATINRLLAEPNIQRARIDFLRAASRSYWEWVAAGQRLLIAERMLEIAQDRDQGLAMRVERQALAPIERTDNLRTIAEREARRVVAERRFQAASITLSLYLRDATGMPMIPPRARLPRVFPEQIPFDQNRAGEAVTVAFDNRPELQRWKLLRERTTVDLRLAENQTLPGVAATFFGARDIGGVYKPDDQPKQSIFKTDEANLEAGIAVELPLQRRDARGKVQTAQAQLAQIMAQERYARDSISVEVRDVLSALDQAYQLRVQARKGFELAEQVEQGERKKFDLGQSTILQVNLRELATFDSALTEVDANLEYFRALADYRAVLGLDGIARNTQAVAAGPAAKPNPEPKPNGDPKANADEPLPQPRPVPNGN